MKITFAFVLLNFLIVPSLLAQNSSPFKEAVTSDGDTILIYENNKWRYKTRAAYDIYDIDGNKYKTIVIDEQVWMAENLRVTRFRNGSPINHIRSTEEWSKTQTPAYASYNNDSSLVNEYGLLYNWYAIINPSCLCPEGWRIPTKEDFIKLTGGRISQDPNTISFGVSDYGAKKLVESGDVHWNKPSSIEDNQSGFSARGGGMRYANSAGIFRDLKRTAYFYSSSISLQNDPFFLKIDESIEYKKPNAVVMAYDGKNPEDSRLFGLSVRCIRIEKAYNPFPNK